LTPYDDPQRTLERLRRTTGAPADIAARELPLVQRALRSPPRLRALLLAAVRARLERAGRGAREQSELMDRRCLSALAPLLELW
jgi:hypothetical protein